MLDFEMVVLEAPAGQQLRRHFGTGHLDIAAHAGIVAVTAAREQRLERKAFAVEPIQRPEQADTQNPQTMKAAAMNAAARTRLPRLIEAPRAPLNSPADTHRNTDTT